MARTPRYFPTRGPRSAGRSPSIAPGHAGEFVSRREHQKEINRPLPSIESADRRAQRKSQRDRSIELSSTRPDANLYVNGVRQPKAKANRWHVATVPDDGTYLPENMMLLAGPDDGESTEQGTTLTGPGLEIYHARAEWMLPCSAEIDCCELSGWVPALSAFLVNQLGFEPIIDPLKSGEESDCTASYDEYETDQQLTTYGYFERIPIAKRQKTERVRKSKK